jgi:hypothetical protein
MSTTVKMQRDEILTALRKRDGDICMYPGCGERLDFSVKLGKLEVTIDHWMPQSFGFANGWTMDEIWDLDNLKLMHKCCNAKKGDLIPNPDGTLPEKPVSQRERRADKSNRPEICTNCNSGRDLGPSEVCGVCGSGPMPLAFPQFAKVKSTECDHQMFWCWACSIGIIPRVPAFVTALDGEFLND